LHSFSAVAELVLLAKTKDKIDKRKLRLNLALGVLAYFFAMWMVVGVGKEAGYWGLILFLSGLPVYALIKWQKA